MLKHMDKSEDGNEIRKKEILKEINSNTSLQSKEKNRNKVQATQLCLNIRIEQRQWEK